ncbi:MAG TPA: FAD-binding oxidoreductase [Solirubrobacteraceae bacterium]|nr:FAD-binding oxidoreductase [Solirubrobacteraceae bacterium]
MARAEVLERLNRGPRVVWQTATVRETTAETPRARTIAFDVPDWPGHRAGQHVDVRLTAEDGYQAQRSYSISSAPELDAIELTVGLVEDGEVSPYLVEELRPGDQIELRGPIGGYFTWSVEQGGPLLLVGGGSGLAPLMAMLRHRAARQGDAVAHVLASARTGEDALYRDELARIEPGATWTFTRAAPAGWTGFARRVDQAMLEAVGPGPDAGARCYVCGPTPFVESVAELLVGAGYDPRSIHAERFGPTGDA